MIYLNDDLLFNVIKTKSNPRNKQINTIHTHGLDASNIDQALNASQALLPSTLDVQKDYLQGKLLPPCYPDSPNVEGLYPFEGIVSKELLDKIDVNGIWKLRIVAEVREFLKELE